MQKKRVYGSLGSSSFLDYGQRTGIELKQMQSQSNVNVPALDIADNPYPVCHRGFMAIYMVCCRGIAHGRKRVLWRRGIAKNLSNLQSPRRRA